MGVLGVVEEEGAGCGVWGAEGLACLAFSSQAARAVWSMGHLSVSGVEDDIVNTESDVLMKSFDSGMSKNLERVWMSRFSLR